MVRCKSRKNLFFYWNKALGTFRLIVGVRGCRRGNMNTTRFFLTLLGLEWALSNLEWTLWVLQWALAKQACAFWSLPSAYFHWILWSKIAAHGSLDRNWVPASERGEITPISPPLAAPLALLHWSGMLRAVAPLKSLSPYLTLVLATYSYRQNARDIFQWKVPGAWKNVTHLWLSLPH